MEIAVAVNRTDGRRISHSRSLRQDDGWLFDLPPRGGCL